MLAAIGAPLIGKFFSWFGGASTAATPDSPYMWFVAGVLAWWLADSASVKAPPRGA
jgi:hypothetical protein